MYTRKPTYTQTSLPFLLISQVITLPNSINSQEGQHGIPRNMYIQNSPHCQTWNHGKVKQLQGTLKNEGNTINT